MSSLLKEKRRVSELLLSWNFSLGERIESITAASFWQPVPGESGAQIFHIPSARDNDLPYPFANMVFMPAGCEVRNVSVAWQVSVFTLIGRVERNGIEHPRFSSCVIPAHCEYTFRALEDTYTIALYDNEKNDARSALLSLGGLPPAAN